MPRLLPAIALAIPCIAGLVLGCAKKFQDMRTPSGEFCSDMQVFPAGQLPDVEYHRLKPVSSDAEARTEPERLESLRKAACEAGGDSIIEAVNEEVRQANATYATVSSGTAIIWVHRVTANPLPSQKTSEPASAETASEPEPAPQTESQPQAAVEEPEPPPMKPEPAKPEPPPAKPSKSTTTSAPAPTTASTKSTTPAPTSTTKTTTPAPAPTSTTKTTTPAPAPTSTTKSTTPAPTSSGKATFLKKH